LVFDLLRKQKLNRQTFFETGTGFASKHLNKNMYYPKTKTMKQLFFSFVFALGFFSVQAQGVAGRVYITSNCASGGMDYFFYEDNTVIGICSGCESVPFVQWGKWDIIGENIEYTLTKQWEGKGVGAPVGACGSVCTYNSYTAKFSKISGSDKIPYEWFEEGFDTESCESFEDIDGVDSDLNKKLRNGFVGKYPNASTKKLQETDLKGISKQELKIMRNEIFARYGYIFKTKEMADYFKKQKNYAPYMENVDAFLSDIELKNIELIKKFEK
jgi:hypothetical protein